ncbi:MAG: hypothetical protein KDA32_11905 [Phycisphaerales bacterium]|nr:hypothetical protein [Phycisphaerales bacterium]
MRDTKRVRWFLVFAGLTIAAPVLAQEESERWKAKVPEAGFWPTERMIDLAIDRITDEMAGHYDLDDEQLYETRATIKERVPKWLHENRAEIQTLMNQFFEAQLSGEAPEPNAVAVWSQRALPLINEFKGVVNNMSDDFREFWNDDQQIMLDGELAAFNTGIGLVNNKMSVWADGGYDPETEWIGDPEARRDKERKEREDADKIIEAARQDAMNGGAPSGAGSVSGVEGAPPAPGAPNVKGAAAPVKPKDEWEQYTDEFIARYKLTDEQQQKARMYLKEAQSNRDSYKAKNASRRVEAEALIKKADTPEMKAEAEASLHRMDRTVDRYFDKLKDNLNRLPTRKQRAEAATLAATPTETTEAAAKPQAQKTPGKR